MRTPMIDPNTPAFPCVLDNPARKTDPHAPMVIYAPGITNRALIAAIQMLAYPRTDERDVPTVAKLALEDADALLAALNEEPEYTGEGT